MKFDPVDPNTLYVSFFARGIWRSRDGVGLAGRARVVDHLAAERDGRVVRAAAPLGQQRRQFVLGGGRALVFVDPICDSDIPTGFQNELQALLQPRGSDMPELLEAWGLRMAHEQVAGDLDNARRSAEKLKDRWLDYATNAKASLARVKPGDVAEQRNLVAGLVGLLLNHAAERQHFAVIDDDGGLHAPLLDGR